MNGTPYFVYHFSTRQMFANEIEHMCTEQQRKYVMKILVCEVVKNVGLFKGAEKLSPNY